MNAIVGFRLIEINRLTVWQCYSCYDFMLTFQLLFYLYGETENRSV